MTIFRNNEEISEQLHKRDMRLTWAVLAICLVSQTCVDMQNWLPANSCFGPIMCLVKPFKESRQRGFMKALEGSFFIYCQFCFGPDYVFGQTLEREQKERVYESFRSSNFLYFAARHEKTPFYFSFFQSVLSIYMTFHVSFCWIFCLWQKVQQ